MAKKNLRARLKSSANAESGLFRRAQIALFPGSFDPFTLGHLDLVQRAAQIFDLLIIGLGLNREKKDHFLSRKDRERLIQLSCKGILNLEVQAYDGLTVDFAREIGATVILRGIRSYMDFEFELPIAHMNRNLHQTIETVFLPCSPGVSHISSSLVREVHRCGGSIQSFVPRDVFEFMNDFR